MREDDFLPRLIFSNKATFYISGKVNRHILRIWGLKNQQKILEHRRMQNKLILKCYSTAFSPNPQILNFNKMEHHRIGIVLFEVFSTKLYLNFWIGRTGPQDLALHLWPPRSPDHKSRITAAVNSLNEGILRGAWDEFNYRLDVIRSAGGGHTEHL